MTRDQARRKVEVAVRNGTLPKPTTCDKCGMEKTRQHIKAHIPNPDTPLDVIWMCPGCFKLANPVPVVQGKRLQNIKKAPPYQQMKVDHALGYSFPELAKLWGLSSSAAAWHLLRARAEAHGEWPLPKPPPNKIRVNVIWDLVRAELAKVNQDEPVIITLKEANRFAPFCRFHQRKKDGGYTRTEVWPKGSPRYHRASCYKLEPAGDAVFAIDADEAEDWGFEACRMCNGGITLDEFARRHGFHIDWVYGLSRGRITHVSLGMARRLLQAIKEPIPESLYTPVELAELRQRKAKRTA